MVRITDLVPFSLCEARGALVRLQFEPELLEEAKKHHSSEEFLFTNIVFIKSYGEKEESVHCIVVPREDVSRGEHDVEGDMGVGQKGKGKKGKKNKLALKGKGKARSDVSSFLLSSKIESVGGSIVVTFSGKKGVGEKSQRFKLTENVEEMECSSLLSPLAKVFKNPRMIIAHLSSISNDPNPSLTSHIIDVFSSKNKEEQTQDCFPTVPLSHSVRKWEELRRRDRKRGKGAGEVTEWMERAVNLLRQEEGGEAGDILGKLSESAPLPGWFTPCENSEKMKGKWKVEGGPRPYFFESSFSIFLGTSDEEGNFEEEEGEEGGVRIKIKSEITERRREEEKSEQNEWPFQFEIFEENGKSIEIPLPGDHQGNVNHVQKTSFFSEKNEKTGKNKLFEKVLVWTESVSHLSSSSALSHVWACFFKIHFLDEKVIFSGILKKLSNFSGLLGRDAGAIKLSKNGDFLAVNSNLGMENSENFIQNLEKFGKNLKKSEKNEVIEDLRKSGDFSKFLISAPRSIFLINLLKFRKKSEKIEKEEEFTPLFSVPFSIFAPVSFVSGFGFLEHFKDSKNNKSSFFWFSKMRNMKITSEIAILFPGENPEKPGKSPIFLELNEVISSSSLVELEGEEGRGSLAFGVGAPPRLQILDFDFEKFEILERKNVNLLEKNGEITQTLELSRPVEGEVVRWSYLLPFPGGGEEEVEVAGYMAWKKGFECGPLVLCLHGGPFMAPSSSEEEVGRYLHLLGGGCRVLIVGFSGSDGITAEVANRLFLHARGKRGGAGGGGKGVRRTGWTPPVEGGLRIGAGWTDVYDCVSAALAFNGEKRCALFGGSYGGFLVLCLLSRFPSFFSCGVARSVFLSFQSAALQTGDFEYCEEYGGENALAEGCKSDLSLSSLLVSSSPLPPLLLGHGTEDPICPLEHALLCDEVWKRRRGGEGEGETLFVFKGGHRAKGQDLKKWNAKSLAFIKKFEEM